MRLSRLIQKLKTLYNEEGELNVMVAITDPEDASQLIYIPAEEIIMQAGDVIIR